MITLEDIQMLCGGVRKLQKEYCNSRKVSQDTICMMYEILERFPYCDNIHMIIMGLEHIEKDLNAETFIQIVIPRAVLDFIVSMDGDCIEN